ncbi:hypothetical protein EYF80_001419 [Liparis tanakae]|uniref:Uncharacterized protein n=1 Tax=Liparis tanakae TaxID=230148 RepID=A0A4Z2JEI8_9TELE|nr:hypothetical protein EYF80_001419 [Liparis tanakae]
MSLDISFSRVSRCLPNSSSGQWRSLMKVCRASSFQKRSSDVPEPLLQGHRSDHHAKACRWRGKDKEERETEYREWKEINRRKEGGYRGMREAGVREASTPGTRLIATGLPLNATRCR